MAIRWWPMTAHGHRVLELVGRQGRVHPPALATVGGRRQLLVITAQTRGGSRGGRRQACMGVSVGHLRRHQCRPADRRGGQPGLLPPATGTAPPALNESAGRWLPDSRRWATLHEEQIQQRRPCTRLHLRPGRRHSGVRRCGKSETWKSGRGGRVACYGISCRGAGHLVVLTEEGDAVLVRATPEKSGGGPVPAR